jgi:putative inorganic carbon (hco3(-)) transporter
MIVFALLLAFFFLDYVRPTSFFPALSILHLNALVPMAMVAGTIALRKDRKPIEGEPSNHVMIAAFLGCIVLSAAFAAVTERVFTIFEAVVGYGAVYWALTQQVDTLNRFKLVVKTLLIVHLVVAALNPLMFTDPDARHYVTSGGFLGDGNDFALSLNIVVPFCLFLMSESKNSRQRGFWALALCVCLASIILTKSRGGTLALGCVGLYYWSKSDKKLLGVVGAVLVVGVILLSAPASYFERMATIGDTQEGSAQGRIVAWTAAVEMATDYPLTGVGAGHFGLTHGKTAHSIYFLVLGELGFPGVILLVAIITRNLTANRRLLKELTGEPNAGTERRLIASLSAAMIAFATAGAFLSAAYYPHLYVIAGLSTAARRLVHERSRAHASVEVRPPVTVKPNAISPEWNSSRGANPLRLPQSSSPAK